MMKTIALIPARKGSKRLPGKNMALLNGKPLLQYAIEGAKKARIFQEIVVSTDWDECFELAENNGVNALMRPPEICQDDSHDYEWVKHALDNYPGFDVFTILRPTSPFRTSFTIIKAMFQFVSYPCDSLRAVEKTRSHPKKSWVVFNGLMLPVSIETINGFPCYDLSTGVLGDVYCQNGCIHIAWTNVLERFGNVSGEKIRPYFTTGREGIDINTPQDFAYAEWIMRGRE